VAVRQVAAVGQVQTHDGVAGRQHGGIGGLVGLRAGVRLHVGVLGAEQFAGASRARFSTISAFSQPP